MSQTPSSTAKVTRLPVRANIAGLRPPRPKAGRLPRPALLAALDAAAGGRMTLLTAPAGYGKTTLLADWVEGCRGRGALCVWAGVRSSEAVMPRLASALAAAGLNLADGVLAALDACPQHIAMVVDLATEPSAEDLSDLAALIADLPEHTHLTLAARRRPALAVAGLVARGEATVIEAEALRFGREELVLLMDAVGAEDDAERLDRQAEGWPVACALARRWREARGPDSLLPPNLVAEVPGLADYMAEEVMSVLSDDQRRLLAECSVLTEIDSALVDHLRGSNDAARDLCAIAALMPGLVRCDVAHDAVICRVHPMVAEHARCSLIRSAVDTGRLHRTASRWFQERERYLEALQHAAATRDDAFIAQTLRSLGPLYLFLRHGTRQLQAFMRDVTPHQFSAHPRLRIMAALLLVKAGLLTEALRELDAARSLTQGFSHDGGGEDAAMIEGLSVDISIRFLRTLDADVVDNHSWPRCDDPSVGDIVAAQRAELTAIGAHVRGDLERAEAALRSGNALYAKQGLTFAQTWLLVHELYVVVARGSLRAIVQALRTTVRRGREPAAEEIPLLPLAALVDLIATYERSPQRITEERLAQALDDLGAGESCFVRCSMTYPVMAERAYRQGGVEGALSTLDQAAAWLRARSVSSLDIGLAALRVRYLAQSGRVAEAQRLADQMQLESRTAVGSQGAVAPWRERDLAGHALAQLHLALGETTQALRYADGLADDARAGGRLRSHIAALTARAQVLMRHGQNADDAILQALRLAFPEGYVAPFCEGGAEIQALLAGLAPDALSKAERQYVDLILHSFEAVGRASGQELFSEREREILLGLANGQSNKVIARRLGITENTVKYHLKKVFAKLGVATRKAAVATLDRPAYP